MHSTIKWLSRAAARRHSAYWAQTKTRRDTLTPEATKSQGYSESCFNSGVTAGKLRDELYPLPMILRRSTRGDQRERDPIQRSFGEPGTNQPYRQTSYPVKRVRGLDGIGSNNSRYVSIVLLMSTFSRSSMRSTKNHLQQQRVATQHPVRALTKLKGSIRKLQHTQAYIMETKSAIHSCILHTIASRISSIMLQSESMLHRHSSSHRLAYWPMHVSQVRD